MSSIKIPNSVNEIDFDLETSSWQSDSEISLDPRQLNQLQSQLFYESALIQWIITRWRQVKTENPLKIGNNDIEIELLKKIAYSTPGTILTLLPNGKIQNVSRRSTAIFREKFFCTQQNWPDLAVNESSAIICLDSYSQGLPKQIYPYEGEDRLTDWDGFRNVIDGLIRSVASEEDVRGKINDRANQISTIILELFKNTHDHARHSADGKIIGDSIRGLYARFYPIENLNSSIAEKGDESLNQAEKYVQLLMRTPQRQIKKRDLSGFLEITIFDSGPGLAAKWLGGNISNYSPQEQLAAVMECFGKGRSSLSTSSRGFGLWKVLEELKNLKGMIRVRTNRVHALRQYAMIQDLFTDQHKDGYSSPQVVMLDWRRGLTQRLSEYPVVDGTLISVLLPLGDL